MYTPLYVQTNYSLLSSLIRIDSLLSYCKKHHIASIAICDPNMYGAMEFYLKCQKEGIKAIIGLELTLEEGTLLLYAKDYAGYQVLMKLATIQSERLITLLDLSSRCEHLVAILPYRSHSLFGQLEAMYPFLYLGYETKEEEASLREKTDRVVFLPHILYLEKAEKEYLWYLTCIRDGKTILEEQEESKDASFVLDWSLVSDEIGVIRSNEIASICQLTFPKSQLLLPIYPCEKGLDASSYLRELSKKGLQLRLKGKVPLSYQERLYYELSVIEKMGFSNYFLVVYDFIKYAKKNGILVGPGRGSAAGSLVSYSLGITDIDPLVYDLLFERFLNPERVSMPDIDTDFPDLYRDQVIHYVVEKYGIKNVAGIVTFGTLGSKQALRDVGRVLNIPLYKIDRLCKFIPTVTKQMLPDFYRDNRAFHDQIESDVSLKRLFDIACYLEGFPRHTSIHAAGIIMCQKPLDEVIPLVKDEGMYLSAYSMEYLESFGLLKMDFLGLKNLTTIMHILEAIKRDTKKVIDFQTIPLDDKKTLSLFYHANTSGIFQFESVGMRNFLRKLKPTSFEDIFAAIALFRPGPAINIDTYIRRKHDQEPITYLDPSLEPILKNTYGILIYQEQIMQVAHVLAGYTLGEADILRRAMSKKKLDVLQNEEEKFVRQSVARGHDRETIQQIFALIVKFAGYGFNRSHSVAYSLVAYKLAYLKAHYPKFFFCSLLTSVIGSESKLKEYMMEARGMGITILKPDITCSNEAFQVVEEGILFPLSTIRGVGSVVCQQIIDSRREGAFLDLYDCLSRIVLMGVNRKAIESCIMADAFLMFHYNRATLLHNLDHLMNYAELTKDLDPLLVMKPEIEVIEEFSEEVLLQQEKEVLGFYLSSHPVMRYRITYPQAILLEQITDYFNQQVSVLILLEKVKVIETKKGDMMAFWVGSDETATADFTLFPSQYALYQDCEKGVLLKVIGRVEKRMDQFQIIVQKVEYLDQNKEVKE